MTKTIDWADIILHAAPCAGVGTAMGFMAAFALHLPTPERYLWIAASLVGVAGFSFLWLRREIKQHPDGGGSLQSKLEWTIPLAIGIATYLAATGVFYLLNL